MSISRTIAMLSSAGLVIFFFYCIGFAIAEKHIRPVFVGTAALLAAAGLIYAQVRMGRDVPTDRSHADH